MILVSSEDFLKDIKKYITNIKGGFIGITGGSGSGKSYIAKKIAEKLRARIIFMDDYYIRGICKDNKDVPEAFNLELLKQNIIDLKNGKEITKPVYTFGLKNDGSEVVKPGEIMILDGLFALSDVFSEFLDFRIFIDCLEKIRLERRLERDVVERKYDKEYTIKRWNETVEPMFKLHVLPQKDKADLIVEN